MISTPSRSVSMPDRRQGGKGGYDGRGVGLARDLAHAREIAGGYLADGCRCWSRNAWNCAANCRRWWLGRRLVRRGVAGGRDRAARRDLRAGDRAGARAARRGRGRGAAAGVAGWRPNSAWSACWPWSCSRLASPAGGRGPQVHCWSTSWPCGRTTPGTGPWTARVPANSNSICVRC